MVYVEGMSQAKREGLQFARQTEWKEIKLESNSSLMGDMFDDYFH